MCIVLQHCMCMAIVVVASTGYNSCSQTCSQYEVVGEMPTYWNWLQFAVYAGTDTITKPTGEPLLLDLWYLEVIAKRHVST